MYLDSYERLRRFSITLVVLGMCGSSVGCLALGLPSERFDDPRDRGGLFGEWRSKPAASATAANSTAASAAMTAELIAQGVVVTPSHGCGMGTGVLDGGGDIMDIDPLSECGGPTPEKIPEVPWPRYHPLPTRPVFGPPGSMP